MSELPSLDLARQALREHILLHSLKTGSFTLKSGKLSNWFLDSKQTACRSDGILLVSDVALAMLPPEIDAIGGLTMGADPVAFGIAAVAATRGRELLPGDRVAIVEDTVTRGTSLFEAVEVVRAFGATPVFITVIVDRGGTCAAMAAEAKITYQPMLTAPDLGYAFGS